MRFLCSVFVCKKKFTKVSKTRKLIRRHINLAVATNNTVMFTELFHYKHFIAEYCKYMFEVAVSIDSNAKSRQNGHQIFLFFSYYIGDLTFY